MNEEKKLTEQESLQLISDMIKKAKGSYHDTGIGSLLWGSVVSIASFITYFKIAYNFDIGFDIWLIVLVAIIPQIFLSIREKKDAKAKFYDDDTVNAVWFVFGITLFGFAFYQNFVPDVTIRLIDEEGWQMMKHYNDASKPDTILRPFVLSFNSLYILLYAFPTLVTGLVKKFKPMTIGALFAYCFFIISCFTPSEYDMLLGGATAIVCWFIPGIILRKKYLAQRKAHV
jgi:hypothetical protein